MLLSCGNTLVRFTAFYVDNLSGYIDLPVCIIGSIFNTFNLLVFTRKNMISPVNLIFTHLAFVDFLLLFVTIPSFFILYIGYDNTLDETRTIIFTCYFDINMTLHCVSIFLTVILAIWRYIAAAYPFYARRWCNMKTTRNVVIAAYIISILLCLPMYLAHDVESSNLSVYSYIGTFSKNPIVYSTVFIIQGVLCRLLPSALLAAFGIKLIKALFASKTNQESLNRPIKR